MSNAFDHMDDPADAGGRIDTARKYLLADDPDRTLTIQRRVHEKTDDYAHYKFTEKQSVALNIFFDLAQQFDHVEDLYTITVTIPKVAFGLDSNLYLYAAENRISLVKSSTGGPSPEAEAVFARGAARGLSPMVEGDRFFLPIRGKARLIEQLPITPPEGNADGVIGCFEVFPAGKLTDHEKLFWEKYANRIGFQLHNRMISVKNQEHLDFIHNLVDDIGHNVIAPNMYFRLFFNRLKGKIEGLKQLSQEMDQRAMGFEPCGAVYESLTPRVKYLYEGLISQFNEIYRHYQQTSMFLETLMRKSHFEEGRYVLMKRECNLRKQVIEPQVEQYRSRFEDKDIELDMSMGGVPDQHIRLKADIGLISQVYANLFSNAVKYARRVIRDDGRSSKFVSYGWDVLPGHFGPGKPGIKLNVFTSGKPLPEEDAAMLFRPGFRGGNAVNEYGTGHGLFFVKQVVELHGGKVGYEPRTLGNNFYFILPMDGGDAPPA